MAATDIRVLLVCRAGALLCALPIEMVVETLRPLPIEPLPLMPGFVAGSSIVRGEPVPVLVLSRLLGAETGTPQRFVVIRAGSRRAALAVDDVIGFRDVPIRSLAALPPLLSGASQAAVAEIGALDGDLLVVLGSANLVPEAAFAALDKNMVPA